MNNEINEVIKIIKDIEKLLTEANELGYCSIFKNKIEDAESNLVSALNIILIMQNKSPI